MSKLSDRRREIRALDAMTAQRELKDLREQLFRLRLQHARGEVKNNRQFPQIRADLARLMHHLGELRHAEEIEAEGGLAEETAGAPTTSDTEEE